jgi:hypothetical protein
MFATGAGAVALAVPATSNAACLLGISSLVWHIGNIGAANTGLLNVGTLNTGALNLGNFHSGILGLG